MISEFFSALISPITTIITNWQTEKLATAQTQADMAEARLKNKLLLEEAETLATIERLKVAASTEASYDQQAMLNMSSTWKDEFLILLHTLPMWGYVIPSPELHASLDLLWLKLETANMWWWLIYIGIISSTFGTRWLFNNDRINSMLENKK